MAMERESGFTVLYKECQKNHTPTSGMHSTDGCNEFILDNCKQQGKFCLACGCHRSFHHKVLVKRRLLTTSQTAKGEVDRSIGRSQSRQYQTARDGVDRLTCIPYSSRPCQKMRDVSRLKATPQSRPNHARVAPSAYTAHYLSRDPNPESLEVDRSNWKNIEYQPLAKRKGSISSLSTCSASKKPAPEEKVISVDPNMPKRPLSSFFIFMEDFRKAYRLEHPNIIKDPIAVGIAAGEKWRSMSHAGQEPYKLEADKRMVDYKKKLKAYNMKERIMRNMMTAYFSDESNFQFNKRRG